MSHSLEKLSLAWLNLSNPKTIDGISQNGQTLKTLDLSGCKGLDLNSIQRIVKNCVELVEMNLDFNNLCPKSVAFFCQNITPKLQKLSLCSIKVTDEDLKVLVTRCDQLKELDLANTSITKNGIKTIISAMSETLIKLRYISTY